MKIFPAQIMEETFTCHSRLDELEFKKQVLDLFNKTGRFRHPPDLDGKFLDQNNFQIVRRWSLPSFMQFPFFNSTYLKVLFLEDINKQTQVTITAVPFTLYPSLFVLLPLVYLYFLIATPPEMKSIAFYLIFLFLFALTPVLLMYLSSYAKKTLLNRFVKSMALEFHHLRYQDGILK